LLSNSNLYRYGSAKAAAERRLMMAHERADKAEKAAEETAGRLLEEAKAAAAGEIAAVQAAGAEAGTALFTTFLRV
jgi:hypothetical protein